MYLQSPTQLLSHTFVTVDARWVLYNTKTEKRKNKKILQRIKIIKTVTFSQR